MKKPFKALFWGDYMCNTGFATVLKNVFGNLRNHFGDRMYADIIAINYIENDNEGNPVPGKFLQTDNGKTFIHPAINEKFKAIDELGRHEFLRFITNYDYDVIYIIQDPGVLAGKLQKDGLVKGNIFKEMKRIISEKRSQNKKQPKIVYYFPIDGQPLSYWFDDLDVITCPVAYTEYGKNQVGQTHPHLKSKIKVIPHGIDTSVFRPLPLSDRIGMKKEYFSGVSDKKIFANINRNQTRKDIPATIYAFEQYKKKDPDSFLYLHMHPEDPQGWKLWWLLKQTGLKENVDFMFQRFESRDITTDLLNEIYNACDYYVTTTTGEGWGLTITEAMACRIPVIAPDHTSISEIGNSSADLSQHRILFLEEFRPYCSHFDNMLRQGCYFEEVAEMMELAVSDNKATERRVELAYNYVQSLEWKNICRKWIDIFESLV